MRLSSASKMNLMRLWRKLRFEFVACCWHIPWTGNSVKFLFWICQNVRNVSSGDHWHTQVNLRLEVFRFPLQENVPFLKRLFFFSWLDHIFALWLQSPAQIWTQVFWGEGLLHEHCHTSVSGSLICFYRRKALLLPFPAICCFVLLVEQAVTFL